MLDFVLAELRDAQASIDGSPGSFYDLAAAAGKYLLITGRRPRFKKSWAKKAARAFKSRLRLILECAQSLRGTGDPFEVEDSVLSTLEERTDAWAALLIVDPLCPLPPETINLFIEVDNALDDKKRLIRRFRPAFQAWRSCLRVIPWWYS